MKKIEILENRRKWVNHLLDPNTKKTIHKLEHIDNPECRCCLGHGCHVLNLERVVGTNVVQYCGNSALAPTELVERMGIKKTSLLIKMNDGEDKSPQEIGKYLGSIMEDENSEVFKPLSNFSD